MYLKALSSDDSITSQLIDAVQAISSPTACGGLACVRPDQDVGKRGALAHWHGDAVEVIFAQ